MVIAKGLISSLQDTATMLASWCYQSSPFHYLQYVHHSISVRLADYLVSRSTSLFSMLHNMFKRCIHFLLDCWVWCIFCNGWIEWFSCCFSFIMLCIRPSIAAVSNILAVKLPLINSIGHVWLFQQFCYVLQSHAFRELIRKQVHFLLSIGIIARVNNILYSWSQWKK